MSRKIAVAYRNPEKGAPYERALREAGLTPVVFSPGSGAILADMSGLFLTGGTDVDPRLYSAVAERETDTPDRERDDYEIALTREALHRNLPLLAICRGSQLLNVACGGTLVQHLPATARHRQRTGGVPVHDVVLQGKLEEIFRVPRMAVNSRHHQAVDRPGTGVEIVARDAVDGVVEGITLPAARFAVAVQWHPENMEDDPRQRRIFAAFAQAAEVS